MKKEYKLDGISVVLPYDDLIKECPSPQIRGYLQKKQREEIKQCLLGALTFKEEE